MKRHGFHGVERLARHAAQAPQARLDRRRATPGRVFKGMRMAGRMGGVRTTTQSLTVHAVDAEKGLLLIKGAVPGPKGGVVLVRTAAKGTSPRREPTSEHRHRADCRTVTTEPTDIELEVRTADGKTDGTVTLPADVFDVQVNVPLIHQVVVAQLAAARQGTHTTKTRGEVRGGGRKPYRQKGTGRARQGSTRAPQFAGGGVVHGPQPRSYAQRTPKKMKAAALRGALSDRARNGRVHVVAEPVHRRRPVDQDAPSPCSPASPSASTCSWSSQRNDELTWKSLRNAARVHLLVAGPAQHLRRARLRRRGLHPRRPRRVPGRPGDGSLGQGQRHRERGHAMSSIHKDHRDVLLSPVVSEKSYGLLDENKYTFLVHPDANKTEIKIAVEKVFGVKVNGVNTLNRQGKRKRTRTGFGRRKATKRAIVTVAEGDRIDIFGGPVS